LADVVLPALGESITEGIITKWFKAVGDEVARDEPLLEISTDKVDSELPSPAAGVLTQILADEGDTVPVGATVAIIGDVGAAATPSSTDAESSPVIEGAVPSAVPPVAETAPAAPGRVPAPPSSPSAAVRTGGQTASPMVRKLLSDAGVAAGDVAASGPGGRITRADAERTQSAPRPTPGSRPGFAGGQSSWVTQGFVAVEADYEGVVRARRSAAASSAETEGIVLDDAVFAVRAAVEALAQFPELNASVSDTGVETHAERNIGVAIDVDGRLLVPVIAGAQDLNLRGLSRRLGELLGRAQTGELAVDDLLGGTFTVAAAPSERVLVSIPGLVEPQVAILSVGGVTRRAVVLTDEHGFDSIAVRSVGVLGLGFDVRVIDATFATRFLERVAELLGSQDWSTEL